MTVCVASPPPADQGLIVHGMPGRLRLRLPLLACDRTTLTRLEQDLSQIIGVTTVRMNRAARSVILSYRIQMIQESALAAQVWDCWQRCPKKTASTVVTPNLPQFSGSDLLTPLPALASAELGWPMLATGLGLVGRWPRLAWLRSLAALALLKAAWPIVQRALRSLVQTRRLNIDCLDFLVLSLSAAQGKLITPALVIALHELGDAIREQTARATEVRTADLLDAIGRWAWVQTEPDHPPQQIPSDRVEVGAVVIVYPGEQIPVDGVVLKGEALVDQQGLTGEAMPVVCQPGTVVLASTLVRSGQIYIRAERVGMNTRVALSLALLQKAPVQDTRMANYAEQLADRLIWPSLILGAIVLITTRDPSRVAAILTLDFVTGVRVSMPTAFLGALNHTTRHGILVRSGRTLEQLAEIDTVVFDKTGTLTQGAIVVTKIQPARADLTAADLLQLAAAAEQRLNHPVAEAICQAARDRALTLPSRDTWQYEVGLGVQAIIDGREVHVGSERFLTEISINIPPNFPLSTSDSQIFIARDREFLGSITYSDPLRAESSALIQTLQTEYGINIYLLTGDTPARAQQVAQTLGIPPDQVYAQAFPDEKARIVRDLHQGGRTVAFVGDGLNDSVALAYADVSISFAHGAEIARETADVVLMNDDLRDLLEAISIAHQTRHLIDQNVALVVVPNLAALGLATTWGLNPLIATAIHNGSAIAAGLNSLRPLVEHQLDGGSRRQFPPSP